jgi:hypothetical protein
MDDCKGTPGVPLQRIFGKGALGVQPGSGSPPTKVENGSEKPTIGNPTNGEKTLIPKVIGFGSVRPRLRGTEPETPVLGVPVQNTTPYSEVFANNIVEVLEFAETMQQQANTLAGQLQSLAAAAQGAGGAGGVSDGVGNSCTEDFEIKANTFITNCNAYILDECGSGKPDVTFNTGVFTITTDGSDMTVTNGTVTLTISGSIINVTGGSLQVDSSNVATEAYADAAAASAQSAAEAYADSAAADAAATLPSHRHEVELDANTATTEYTGYAGT